LEVNKARQREMFHVSSWTIYIKCIEDETPGTVIKKRVMDFGALFAACAFNLPLLLLLILLD